MYSTNPWTHTGIYKQLWRAAINVIISRVLFAAAQAGLFRSGGVLVGSHAFVAIGNMLSVSWVKNTVETQDVDQAAQIIAVLMSQRPGDLWLALDAAADYHAKFMIELKAGIELLDDDLREVLIEQVES